MKNLIVFLGPTAVGKTAFALQVAEFLNAPILSADSRQIFRDIPVCTAAPTAEEQARVKHCFVGTKDLDETYSAAQFETDVLQYIEQSPEQNFILCGGSMMYIDAVCKGIDDMPQADPEIRAALRAQFESEGLEPLLQQLKKLDPEYFSKVDTKNPQRVIHGLEMCLTTGQPFSTFRTGHPKARPFNIFKIGILCPRAELYLRIELRVKKMIENGLEAETRKVYDRYADSLHRQLAGVIRNPSPTQAQPIPNLLPVSLNTVGLKEMLLYYEGIYTRERALERIVHNSRIYAKKQMTWFMRDDSIRWFEAFERQGFLISLKAGDLATKGIENMLKNI
ncbi:MAG: tRNA (adenosine(37)-N6)-dimethylallyltransferase MiaA [Bacteroidales bacterium]|nr:tRNA (adenosine(37)-N6)-dimethylallyltransferase MiaA [Bacteroidales bacterium]